MGEANVIFDGGKCDTDQDENAHCIQWLIGPESWTRTLSGVWPDISCKGMSIYTFIVLKDK